MAGVDLVNIYSWIINVGPASQMNDGITTHHTAQMHCIDVGELFHSHTGQIQNKQSEIDSKKIQKKNSSVRSCSCPSLAPLHDRISSFNDGD